MSACYPKVIPNTTEVVGTYFLVTFTVKKNLVNARTYYVYSAKCHPNTTFLVLFSVRWSEIYYRIVNITEKVVFG